LAAATAKAAAAAAAAATEVQRRFEATVHFNNIAAAHHHVTTQNACAGVAELPRVMRGDGCNNGFWDTHHADACPKLQHQLTGHYHDTLVRQLAASSTSFRTRIASCRTRMASLWLSSRIGECGGRHLSNAHAVCALRQRIGAPPVDQLPSKCTCNTSLTSAEEQYGHVHWCSKLKAASTALRHNIVVDAINNACRNAGVSTRVEVVQPSFSVVLNRNRSLRPDLLLYGTNNTLFVDIAVCHPLAPSHIKKHAPRDSDDRRLRTSNNRRRRSTRRLRHCTTPRSCRSCAMCVRRDGCERRRTHHVDHARGDVEWSLRGRCCVQSSPPRRTRPSFRRHPASCRDRGGIRCSSHPFRR
jgi:hypothetical protein